MPTAAALAAQILQRIDALAEITEEPGRLTRTYGSPAMRRANELVAGWMREAGLTPRTDAIGNLLGRYHGTADDAKTFLLGSHLDSVRDAGRFDGPLGVLVALACVQRLQAEGRRLPFHVEVAGFADEEGVRFHSTYLGSRALAGTLTEADLARTDAAEISLRVAILHFGGDPAGLHGAQWPPDQLLGYAEVHLEQGPLLEAMNAPVGVVSAIAGQSRIAVEFIGSAAHAGTTPMSMRRDALAAAAQFISAVETCARQQPGLIATVGQVAVEPNVSNVIPGRVRLTVDVRHQDDTARAAGCAALGLAARQSATSRGIEIGWEIVQETAATPCSARLLEMLRQAASRHASEVPMLPSGAGHDAVALASITPVAMLFVRCQGGLSHHPAESVREADVAVAIAVMGDFLELLARQAR